MQTLRNFICRNTWPDPAGLGGARVMFEMDDGTGDRLPAALHMPNGAVDSAPKRPLVILIHGMSGCEESAYVLFSAAHFLGLGHPVLRLNLRGAGPAGKHCSERYHAGRTADLRAVLAQIPAEARAKGCVAVGYSLGGNMLLKHLGEQGAEAGLLAAVSVSAPIDLAAASARMLERRNRPYTRFLVGQLVRETLAGKNPAKGAEAARLRACRSVREFDEVFTAPRNGYADAAAYYDDCSAGGYLADISVPALLIHAPNDPWIPIEVYDGARTLTNPALSFSLDAAGGHVGFHGRGLPAAWHDLAADAFFSKALAREMAA